MRKKNCAKVRKKKICAKIAQILRKKYSHFVETLVKQCILWQIFDFRSFFWNFCIFSQNFLISYFAKFSHFSRVKEMQKILRINCFSKKCEIFAKQFSFFAGNPRSRCWSYVHQEVAKQLKKSMYIIKDKNCPNHTENSFRVAIMLNLYWQMSPPPLPILSQCSAP